MKNVLTIAGSDSSGGAGIQADLRTMSAFQIHGMSAITAITAQNSRGVSAVAAIAPEMVKAQIAAIYDDIPVHAVKVGMILNADIARAIVEELGGREVVNLVVDPVMVSKSGSRLIDHQAEQETMRLVRNALIITPNLLEASFLADMPVRTHDDMVTAAMKIQTRGARNVLVKGGARQNDADDFLLLGDERVWLRSPRINTSNIHGAGCTLSSAIACRLALGDDLLSAVQAAKQYITRAIASSYQIGSGPGPLGHLATLYRKLNSISGRVESGGN